MKRPAAGQRQALQSDPRYTIGTEWTGHPSARPRWVIRFAGERIEDHATKGAALVRAACLASARRQAPAPAQ